MIENRSGKKLRILETSERSREVSKMAAERTEPDKVVPRPNPEVAARATRRRFSARYKLRILEQADGCPNRVNGGLTVAEKGFTGLELAPATRARELLQA